MIKKVNNQGFGIIPILVLSLFVGLSSLFVYRYYFYANSISNTEVSDLQAYSEGINPQGSSDEDSNVLAAITPGTTFNYYLTGNNTRVDMYGNPLFVRQLTFAPNRVRVTLVSNTGVETNRDLTLTNISGGKRIAFPITATTAKIEFRSVTGIITGDKPAEWSDTPTKNGIQRTVTVCTNPDPAYLYCHPEPIQTGDGSTAYRAALIGCGTKLEALKNSLISNGLLWNGDIKKALSTIEGDSARETDDKNVFSRSPFKANIIKISSSNFSSTKSKVTASGEFSGLEAYFLDVSVPVLSNYGDRYLPVNSYSLIKDKKVRFAGSCSDLSKIFTTSTSTPQSIKKTSGNGTP